MDSFQVDMSKFYQDLLDSQKPADPEYIKALWKNIWDLYSYSDEKKWV
jgi:hypothetical protein